MQFISAAFYLSFGVVIAAVQPVLKRGVDPVAPNGTISSTPSTLPSTETYSSINSSYLTSSTPTSVQSSTITSWPTFSYPPCSTPASLTDTAYCRIHVGTVQLHYWPTGTITRNLTYPKTTVLTEYDLTMTSPLVYYVMQSMAPLDWCSQPIGPILTNFITSFPLSEVSTLQPFANSITASRIGPPQQIQLSDLRDDCPIATTHPPSNHNVLDPEDPGCNPVIVWNPALMNAGGPAWNVCGRYYGGKLGIFDPPIPVLPCTLGQDCGNAGAITTTTGPVLVTTPLPDEPATTSSVPLLPSPSISSGPSSTSVVTMPSPTSTTTLQDPGDSTVEQAVPVTTETQQTQTLQTIDPQTTAPESSPAASLTSTLAEVIISTSSSAIATLPNSVIISGAAGDSSILIGSQTLSAGGPPITVTEGGVLSLATSGGGLIISNSGSVSTILLPTSTPQAPPATTLGIVAGQTISGAIIGSSQLAVGSQTLSIGGSAVTLAGNQVASLGSSGLVIQAPSGVVSTFAIPTSTTAIIGIIAGQTVSGVAVGTSAAVVGSQTLTIGGDFATLAGNQVASLGASGVVVQAPGGVVTTIPLQLSSSVPISLYTIAVGPGTTLSGTQLDISSGSSNSITSSSTSIISSSSISAVSTSTSTGLGTIILNTFEGGGGRLAVLAHLCWFPFLAAGVISILR